MRIGQILDSFMTVVTIAHRNALLSCQRQQHHGDRPPHLNQNIAMRPGYKGK